MSVDRTDLILLSPIALVLIALFYIEGLWGLLCFVIGFFIIYGSLEGVSKLYQWNSKRHKENNCLIDETKES